MPVSDSATSQVAAMDDALVWIDCEVREDGSWSTSFAAHQKPNPLLILRAYCGGAVELQMTGLNPDTEEILEIYCILTTANLDIVDPEGFHAVIHWPKSRLDQMDDWCTHTHGKSGLTAAVIASDTTPAQAADALHRYITRFVPRPRTALLAGNSVHADRAFLRKEPFAKVVEHLHYRILDVSSIKEAARRWSRPEVLSRAPAKMGRHKARDDILESIEEARYYREVIFGAASSSAASPAAGEARTGGS